MGFKSSLWLLVMGEHNTNIQDRHNLILECLIVRPSFLRSAIVLRVDRQVFHPFIQGGIFWHLVFSKPGPFLLHFEVSVSHFPCSR